MPGLTLWQVGNYSSGGHSDVLYAESRMAPFGFRYRNDVGGPKNQSSVNNAGKP